MNGIETCDDGKNNGNGCLPNCTLPTSLWTCTSQKLKKSICEPLHSDGYIVGNEQCDDGNRDNTDGCTNDGKLI